MQFKDYYQTLGLEPGAGDAEIKTAYRRLARKYHPDVSKEPSAEDKFKAVNEAYEALRDPAKRSAYDQLRARGYRPGEDIQPPPGGFGGGGRYSTQDFEEIFAG
ncbi:MAG TPA: DnaJ domain-containing protein, partial [Lysobacter sp.]